MNNHIVQKIITAKISCYFVSPHLDDAMLSAGGLLAYLSSHTQVDVVTVFTHASARPYTLSAETFLKQCGYTDADTLFDDRRNEDTNACAIVGITPHHLGQVDALWRKIPSPNFLRKTLSRILPEFLHVYPTYRMHIIRGGVSRHDTSLSNVLGEELKKIIGAQKEYALFCPLALRSHVDHVLVRDVCLAHFDNVFMWQDFPYNTRNSMDVKKTDALGIEAFRWDTEKEKKKEMIASYTSQVQAMFPDGNIPLMPEVYYAPREKM
jgi:LmbE family N-acetylglucosaminyl deacetylase